MEHSRDFKKIKNWYDLHIFPLAAVRNAVKKERITKEEYREITGKEYE